MEREKKSLIYLMFYPFLQVREKLIDVTKKRAGMNDQWETRWEYLQLSKLTLQCFFCRSATEYYFFALLSQRLQGELLVYK